MYSCAFFMSPSPILATISPSLSNKKIAKINNQEKTKKPQKTKEKIANNDLFLVTREYVDPSVISKTPDSEETITIDFSRERYITTIPLKKNTRDKLKKFGQKGETYDSVLNKLISNNNISLISWCIYQLDSFL